MGTYVIGDVQGCFEPLRRLLKLINYSSEKDILWFTGDLVNRGPSSLETLRFVQSLPADRCQIVLGNHDLHLLAVALGAHPGWEEDTLAAILTAPDKAALINWLRHQPLFYYHPDHACLMVHAGLAASWSLGQALSLAKEVESVLQGDNHIAFFQNMYGDQPAIWDDTLTGWDRLRCITNYFTRSRLCEKNGALSLDKGKNIYNRLYPWFTLPTTRPQHLTILFGHWAALGGVTNLPHIIALDTGCVWGKTLTAYRLEDKKRFSVDCASCLSN